MPDVSPRPRLRAARAGGQARAAVAFAAFVCLVGSAAPTGAAPPPTASWEVVGGDAGGSRYSPLADIGRSNVAQLREAWRFRHGDVRVAAADQDPRVSG